MVLQQKDPPLAFQVGVTMAMMAEGPGGAPAASATFSKFRFPIWWGGGQKTNKNLPSLFYLCSLRIISQCPTGCPQGLRETLHPARSNDSPFVVTRSLGRNAQHNDARSGVLAMEQHQHGRVRSQGVLPSVLVLLSQSCHLCPSGMQCHGTNPSSAQAILGCH